MPSWWSGHTTDCCALVLPLAGLYPPLVATLLALTAPQFDPPPDIVIAYKVRARLLSESSM